MAFLNAQFNPTKTIGALTARQRGFKPNFEDEMDAVARMVSVSLATSAIPYGVDGNAREAGEKAVRKQIYQVYATPGMVYGDLLNASKEQADAFYRAIRAGFYSGAKEIMKLAPRFAHCEIGMFDGGKLHQSRRNNRGRISKSQKPVLIVVNKAALHAYIKKEVDLVGFGKAGWANCARGFAAKGATRGLPGWVTRHKNAPGRSSKRVSNNGAHIEITLTNDVKYAENLLTASVKASAYAIAIDRLVKSAVTAERKAAAAAPLS